MSSPASAKRRMFPSFSWRGTSLTPIFLLPRPRRPFFMPSRNLRERRAPSSSSPAIMTTAFVLPPPRPLPKSTACICSAASAGISRSAGTVPSKPLRPAKIISSWKIGREKSSISTRFLIPTKPVSKKKRRRRAMRRRSRVGSLAGKRLSRAGCRISFFPISSFSAEGRARANAISISAAHAPCRFLSSKGLIMSRSVIFISRRG